MSDGRKIEPVILCCRGGLNQYLGGLLWLCEDITVLKRHGAL